MADNKELKYKLSLQDLFSKKMSGAVNETKRMDSAMSGLGSRIAGVAAGIGIGVFAKELVTTGAKFDSYKLQLETLLGSQRLASEAFNQIKADAAKTPFDVESLTRANSMLISAGASAGEARETVLGLGNAIAATGGGSDELMRMSVNLQQIKTLGKASAMDVKQFAFAGIPIYQMLSKTMGLSIEKVREMPVTYEQLKTAFEKAAGAGGMFAGGLEKQSKSIGGQISNLKDQFTNALVDFYDKLKPTISSIIGFLSKLLSWTVKNKETVILIGKIVGIVAAAALAYKAWAGATLIMETAQIALNFAMTANPIGAVIMAITALVAIMATLISEYKSLQDLHEESMRKGIANSYKEEAGQVQFLADKYEKLGYSKLKAEGRALEVSKKTLAADYAEVKSALAAATTDEQKRIAQKRLADLGGRNEALADIKNKGLSNVIGKGSDVSGGKAGGGTSSSSVGSSTEVSATRPQSLVINIGKMVETFELHSSNVTEGFDKIKQKLGNMLVEVANDANNAALNA